MGLMLTPLHRASPANTLSPAARFAVLQRTGWAGRITRNAVTVARVSGFLTFGALFPLRLFCSLATTKRVIWKLSGRWLSTNFRAAQISSLPPTSLDERL